MTENVTQPERDSAKEIQKVFDAWSEFLKLPSIGPGYAFSKDFSSYANSFSDLVRVTAELRASVDSYWSLINKAFVKAVAETIEKSPKQYSNREDLESLRRVMIEAFENAFSELFASAQFSEVYGKVFSSELDLKKTWQGIVEKNLSALNLPTRAEVDEMLRDLHDLKKNVRSIERSVEDLKDGKDSGIKPAQ